ncbi:MAG: helix-turn-helix domain-containing protein [Rhodobacteraceae bacterium]|nr:helix-turn-helix domain-containing protein [Paracoccaceae bacterium]
MNLPARAFPQPPARAAPYVEILGAELTVQFLLIFGGAELYIPPNPKGQSRLEALIGSKKTKAFAQSAHLLQRRVPQAIAWVAACLHFQGIPTNEIARKLRVTDVTERRYLKSYEARGTP